MKPDEQTVIRVVTFFSYYLVSRLFILILDHAFLERKDAINTSLLTLVSMENNTYRLRMRFSPWIKQVEKMQTLYNYLEPVFNNRIDTPRSAQKIQITVLTSGIQYC